MSRSYAVFYSPAVAKGAHLSILKSAFDECGLDAQFYEVDSCEKVAAKSKADVLVAAGGDGTVNSVATVAYHQKKLLGIVPMGTLNHFAKDLGVPLVPLQAVEMIAAGKTDKVDIGTCSDIVFVNNASIGIYPTMVRTRAKFERYITKWPAALVAVMVVAVRRLRLYSLQITLDGKTLKRRSSLLFVGNNKYDLQGAGLPERKNLQSGNLQFYILKTKRVNRLLKVALFTLMGWELPERYIERFSGSRLKVEITDRTKLWLAYDGEIKQLDLPLVFKLESKVLSVIVP